MPFSQAARDSANVVTGRTPVIQPSTADLAVQRMAVTLPVADLALNSIGALGILPAGCVPQYVDVDATRVDTNGAPAFAFSVGIVNDAETAISAAAADGGGAWLTGRTEGRAAGLTVAGPLVSSQIRGVAPAAVDRKLGIQVTAAPATAQAGTIALTVYYRNA